MFHGWPGAITGMCEASPHPQMAFGENPAEYPALVAGAVGRLLESGIAGPYGLALGPEQYRHVVETAERGGYPLVEHQSKLVEGPIVWTPGPGMSKSIVPLPAGTVSALSIAWRSDCCGVVYLAIPMMRQ